MYAGLLAVGVALTACGGGAMTTETQPPVVAEEIGGSEISRLTLSESAAERLDIKTSIVEATAVGLVVPSAAVIIDPTGAYWVYTNPEPLVYLRHEIRPVREEGRRAYFEDGPATGTTVVITGVPELYGAEFGIGK